MIMRITEVAVAFQKWSAASASRYRYAFGIFHVYTDTQQVIQSDEHVQLKRRKSPANVGQVPGGKMITVSWNSISRNQPCSILSYNLL